MSDFLIWRDAWLIGIDELDADHRKIVELVNRLADATDATPLAKRLNALTAHLHAHFAREEQLLDEIDYPDFPFHAHEHALQMAEFTQMRRDLEVQTGKQLDEVELQSIKNWFFNHVIVEDRRFADFYRKNYLANRGSNPV